MPTFEEILAEAEATVARVRSASGRKAPVRPADDPARDNLYTPFRNVYLFYRSTCRCGRVWEDFEGIYEDRRHPKGLMHWVRLDERPANNLPKATEYRDVTVPYCEGCALNATPKETEPEPQAPRIAAA